jgi:DNA-binding transcriptional regulator YiaG
MALRGNTRLESFWNLVDMAVLKRDVVELSEARHAASDGRLRAVRLQAKLSQADVARALGVAEATISRWEAGIRRPRRAEAERLAALLRLLEDHRHPPAGKSS